MTVYLSLAQVIRIHGRQVEAFGGPSGVRDRGALEAALARPQMTFDGEDLYPDVAAKSAALLHSLVQNHPFVEGNKRVGAMAAELFLLANDFVLDANDDAIVRMVLEVARGRLAVEAIAIWMRQRMRGTEG